MDDKLFNQHFGGPPESTVLKPEASTPSGSLRRGAAQAAATVATVGDALSNKPTPQAQDVGNTGGPRYDRYRAKPYLGN